MKKLSQFLSSPILLHWALPILMVYLIIGTVAQKYIGLYEATQMFFSSVVFWWGSIPLPGLPIFLALIFLNLTLKLVFKSPWRIEKSGTVITHIGAMLLLFGGLLTVVFSQEGFVDLAVNETKAAVTDYHIREFVMLDAEGKEIQVFQHKDILPNDTLSIAQPSLKIGVLETCKNCTITKRRFVQESYFGMAQHMELSPGALQKEDEENMAGLVFSVSGTDEDGVYIVLENVPKFPEVTIGDQTYTFVLRKQKRSLPFEIELREFKRDMYPGTNLAKAYQSRVLIKDGDAQWESLISMNEPLRYKGYTIFQSAFIETPEGDVSVLAIVENAGRSFPYISGIVMCLGMIVHLFVRRRSNKKNSREKILGY